jgi:caa(3)-type oxidase subunit IV
MLTSLTFGVSQIAPKPLHLPAAVLIAATKATLVAAFFMHLKYSSGAMRLTLILSVGFVLLLMAGILADIHTRPPFANSNDSELAGKDVAEKSVQARESYGPPPPVIPVEPEAH